MVYSPPNVKVNVLQNPRIINISEQVQIPALIGTGPMTIYVVDEAVARGVSALDSLQVYPGVNVVIQKVTKRTGVQYVSGSSSNSVDAITGLYGSLYLPSGSSIGGQIIAGYTAGTTGQITWSQDPVAVATGTVPATGSTYYVSYSYSVDSTQFDPTVFSDKTSIIAKYGEENNVSGSLAIGGSIVLENGSPAVVLCQVSGSTPTESGYRTAIDKLRKKTNIEEVVLLFPTGSLAAGLRMNSHVYLYQHVQLMNLAERWRGMFFSVGSPYYNPADSSSVFDTIGDSSTAGTYLGVASQFAHPDVTLVAPSYVWRTDSNNSRIELDGGYAAAAVAGVASAQTLRSTPITGFTVTGINIETDKWDMFQMNSLGAGGVLVLQNANGVITIRDSITTSTTSADTQERSVVSQRRKVQRVLSTQLFNIYTNKGKTINASTISDVAASVRTILNSLRNQGEIYGYGIVDNPSTGETKISAVQDTTEPRQINISCSVKYLYPLKFLVVNVNLFV